MLLDDIMPTWDAARIEHRVIPGGRAQVFAAAIDADLLDVPRRHAIVRVLFAARTAGERTFAAVRSAPRPPVMDAPSMRLGDMPETGEWVRLGIRDGEEFVFGAVGRFWAGETRWEPVTADAFAGFDRPGFARIGCNLSLREYGPTQTLVSYEARTQATDSESRTQFLRYWRVVDPFVGVVMRATLRLIESDTTQVRPSAG